MSMSTQRLVRALFHLLVVAATAEVSNPVADAADLRTAGHKIPHRQQLTGVTLDKNEMHERKVISHDRLRLSQLHDATCAKMLTQKGNITLSFSDTAQQELVSKLPH